MDPRKTENIDNLQHEIYKRDFKSTLPPTTQHFSEHEVDVEKQWQHNIPSQDPTIPPPPKKVVAASFFRKILTFSIIFFVVSAALLVYMFLNGWNIISANNVSISFLGPVTIAAGDELSFDVVIDNQNRSAIENATLYIDYPDGTKEVQDITQDLLHDTFDIGEVPSKMNVRRTSRSILFGELNSQQNIKVAIEYGIKNSNASYRKEKEYEVTISSTPITITVVHPEQVISNNSIEFKASIISNSNVALTNVLLKVEYPFGFTYNSATPSPTYESSYWLIPTLNPGEKVDIALVGQVQGEQNDERVFRFTVGAQSPKNQKDMVTRYLSQRQSVFVQRPPLAVSMNLNGSSTPVLITKQGDSIQGKIDVVNNLPTQVVDNKIELVLTGQLFDPSTVRSNTGFYQSSNNTIYWDKISVSKLEKLDPGEKVSVTFDFSTKEASAESIKNSTMSLRAKATGRRVSETDPQNVVTSVVKKDVRIQTSIGVLSQVVYSTGPFKNKGPIPPKADTKTTYTVTLSATNSSNDVRGAEVKAVLPSYVRWVGATYPASESITWNSDKNEVIWRVGDVVAGTGGTRPARQVAFQIELTPSITQVGKEVGLVGEISMVATDSFTNAVITATGKDLSTRLINDPKYSGEEASVTN